ncbi:MAG: hypothetical protein ACYDDN_03630 [Candidatus Desulforudaceae bacterium]
MSKEGFVQELEPVDPAKVRELRKYEIPNQGVSFPVFNVRPLLQTRTSEAKNSLKVFRSSLMDTSASSMTICSSFERLWEESDQLWIPKKLKDIDKCLRAAGLRELLGDNLEHEALDELFTRSAGLSADRLKEGIRKFLIEAVSRLSRDTLIQMEPLLVSTASQPSNVSLVLELADRSFFDYPANDPKIQNWINTRLQSIEDTVQAGDTVDLDAFGLVLDTRKTFPNVKVPIVGPVIIRSMNKESPCQKRYGRIDIHSFPAGNVVRQRAKDSLEWLAQWEHKGMTWENISGACQDKGILFAYPVKLGAVIPQLASLFGGDDPDGTRFKKAAKQVVDTLKGTAKEHPQSEIKVFAIAKADKARTKTLFSSSYGVGQLLTAAEMWEDGCQNIPWIGFSFSAGVPPSAVSVVPLPSHVVECVNTAWLRQGNMARRVHGLKVGEGIAILMESGIVGMDIVEKTLRLTVRNSTPLLLALGHQNHRRDASFKTEGKNFVWHAQRLPSLLGLLLFRLNLKRSDYMHRAPFLVGRLLSLSDTLHKEYCRHVRNDLPPQLLGNTLMGMSLDNPVEGLARLSERLPLYKGWADTGQGKDIGLAKWALGQISQISNELSSMPLPDRASDADKAQILLGYLAGSGKDSDKAELTNK